MCCEVKRLHQPSASFPSAVSPLLPSSLAPLFFTRTSSYLYFISVDLFVPANMPYSTFTEVFPPGDVCPTLHATPPLSAPLGLASVVQDRRVLMLLVHGTEE